MLAATTARDSHHRFFSPDDHLNPFLFDNPAALHVAGLSHWHEAGVRDDAPNHHAANFDHLQRERGFRTRTDCASELAKIVHLNLSTEPKQSSKPAELTEISHFDRWLKYEGKALVGRLIGTRDVIAATDHLRDIICPDVAYAFSDPGYWQLCLESAAVQLERLHEPSPADPQVRIEAARQHTVIVRRLERFNNVMERLHAISEPLRWFA
jgi:hypothetical protein